MYLYLAMSLLPMTVLKQTTHAFYLVLISVYILYSKRTSSK